MKCNFFKIKVLTFFMLLAIQHKICAITSLTKAINIDSLQSATQVIKEASYIIDKTATKTIQDVLATPQNFIPNENGFLNFGYFDRQVWLKFSVQSSTKEKLLLEFHPYHTDTVILYCLKNGVIQSSIISGISFLKLGNTENAAYDRLIFPFEIDSGNTEVYLQMKAKYSSIRASIKLWQQEKYF